MKGYVTSSRKFPERLRRRAICDLQVRWATLYIVSFRGRRSARVQISSCWRGVGGEGAAPPPKANQTLKRSTTKEITRNYKPYRPLSEGHLKSKSAQKDLTQPKPKALYACKKTATNKLRPKASKSISERNKEKTVGNPQTRGPGVQRTRTKGPGGQRACGGPKDQGTRGPKDQWTSGLKDPQTTGPGEQQKTPIKDFCC